MSKNDIDNRLICLTLGELKTLINTLLFEPKPTREFVSEWFRNRKYRRFPFGK